MLTLGQDPAQVTQAGHAETRTPAEPVFASLLADWSRHVRGASTAAHITGAAVSGCAPGTGWPLKATA